MGRFRRWLCCCFYVKVREILDLPKYSSGEYDDFQAVSYFSDGATYTWRGRPWVLAWEDFKEALENRVEYVIMNIWVSFRRFAE